MTGGNDNNDIHQQIGKLQGLVESQIKGQSAAFRKIDTIKDDVGTLKTDVQSVKTSLSSVKGGQTRHNGRLKKLEATAEDYKKNKNIAKGWLAAWASGGVGFGAGVKALWDHITKGG